MNYIRKNIVLILAGILLFPLTGLPQSKEELQKEKRQAQKQIELTNKLLNETRKGRKKSYNELLLLKKRISSRQELIDEINWEIDTIDQHISENQKVIDALKKDIEKLKERYAHMVRYAYKTKSSTNRLLFILAAEDFNQAYKRLAYLKDLAKFRREQADAIISMKASIEKQNEKMKENRKEKENLLKELGVEKEKLYHEKEEQNSVVKNLRKKEEQLEEKRKEQKRRAEQLQKEIEKLIAAEAKKNSGSSYSLTPEEKIISTKFGNNKGRLPWPVKSGVITSKFGRHPHPVIKGVHVNNNGVDIATSEGSTVRTLFDGEVRKVFNVPGYQNAVIIRHGSYLTTYTHLENVYVTVGDKVKAKQSIGTVHTNNQEGETVVHVEIWYGQKKLNPEQWLAK